MSQKPVILNEHEAAEITTFREEQAKKKHKLVDGVCLWCDKPFKGRHDKKFCTAVCKANYHKGVIEIERDKLRVALSALRQEYEDLVRELSEVRKELEEVKRGKYAA